MGYIPFLFTYRHPPGTARTPKGFSLIRDTACTDDNASRQNMSEKSVLSSALPALYPAGSFLSCLKAYRPDIYDSSNNSASFSCARSQPITHSLPVYSGCPSRSSYSPGTISK